MNRPILASVATGLVGTDNLSTKEDFNPAVWKG